MIRGYHIALFVFPFFYFASILLIKIKFNDFYLGLIQEDSYLENLQVILYLFSFYLSCLLVKKLSKSEYSKLKIFFSGFALTLLIVALEEISWGQRLFEFTTPEYFKINNIQSEISFHNLKPVQKFLHMAYILIGLYGAFAWLILNKLTRFISEEKRNVLSYLTPPWFLSSYFLLLVITYSYLEYLKPGAGSWFIWRDQEPAELLYALALAIYLSVNLKVTIST